MKIFISLLSLVYLASMSHVSYGAIPSQGQVDTISDIGVSFVASKNSDAPGSAPGRVPDDMGAIGPDQYIMHINQGIRSFDKQSGNPDGVLNMGAIPLLASTLVPDSNTASDPGDPRIRFDKWSQRWFALATSFEFPSTLYVVVSDGPVITQCTQWKQFGFNQTLIPEGNGPNVRSGNAQLGDQGDFNSYIDFPTLGIDAYALYVGVDIGNNYTIYVINKESLLGNDEPIIRAYRNLFDYLTPPVFDSYRNLAPADNWANPDPKFGYLIGAGKNVPNSTLLYFYKVQNPASSEPILLDPILIEVESHYKDIALDSLPHKGAIGENAYVRSIGPIKSSDAVVQADPETGKERFFTAFSVSVNKDGISSPDVEGDRVGTRWYEISDIDTTPNVYQTGTIFDSRDTDIPVSYFGASIMANKQGDVTISCSRVSADTYIEASTFRRAYTDPLGALGPEQSLIKSQYSYNFQLSGGGQRWGDYTYTSLDPSNEIDMWTIQQFIPALDVFGQYVAQLKPQP